MPKSLIALMAALTLAACATRVVDPNFTGLPDDADPTEFRCCADPERQPDWIANLARNFAEPLAPLFASDEQGGFLAQYPEASQRIEEKAQPLDLLVMSSKSMFTSRMLPGWFTHSAIYLGTETQLRAMGLWDDPKIVRYQADIRAGRVIVEGVAGGVHIETWDHVLGERDAVALIRTNIQTSEKRASLERALSMAGADFDYQYDVETCDRFACSEVLCRSFPTLSFPIRETYGTKVLLPDDIAAKAIRGEEIHLIDYVRADKDGWESAGQRGAMEDVAAFWGSMTTAPVSPVTGSKDLGTCALPLGSVR